MDDKYELSPDGGSLVLKQGYAGRLGGVRYLQSHDNIFGGNNYDEVTICLAGFQRRSGAEFPRFLKQFTFQDKKELCDVSNHCKIGEETGQELRQIIELSRLYGSSIARSDDSLCRRGITHRKPL